MHPTCTCGSTKYFNNTPPLRSDGKSINCELNKFDSMIAFLAASDAEFTQVIAVDRDFRLFSRAWCVAELAEADRMGMQQHMKLVSRAALDKKRDQLEYLDVQEMQATRSEDVQEILSKISDVAAFNARTRNMLFGSHGLFLRWAKFDLVRQATEIARVALMAAECRKANEEKQAQIHSPQALAKDATAFDSPV
jgi:hypothetical protein